MRTALDSSVLILLYRKQADWEAWRDCLQAAVSEGELVISPIAFSEYSIAYPSMKSACDDLERLQIYGSSRKFMLVHRESSCFSAKAGVG